MQYILLCTAIILEIIATTLLKTSEGFTKLLPAFGCIVLYICCFYAFSKALLRIDLGVAYATWCAGGIVATTIISALVFGQKLNTIGVIAIVPDHRRLRDPESLRHIGKLTLHLFIIKQKSMISRSKKETRTRSLFCCAVS